MVLVQDTHVRFIPTSLSKGNSTNRDQSGIPSSLHGILDRYYSNSAIGDACGDDRRWNGNQKCASIDLSEMLVPPVGHSRLVSSRLKCECTRRNGICPVVLARSSESTAQERQPAAAGHVLCSWVGRLRENQNKRGAHSFMMNGWLVGWLVAGLVGTDAVELFHIPSECSLRDRSVSLYAC